jgi:hypothetical protein
MKKRLYKTLVVATFALPAIVPMGCSEWVLPGVTPFLLDGSNAFIINSVWGIIPYLLP